MGEKSQESTWSPTCCVFLSELVTLLQLVKPPVIYALRGHDSINSKSPLFFLATFKIAIIAQVVGTYVSLSLNPIL